MMSVEASSPSEPILKSFTLEDEQLENSASDEVKKAFNKPSSADMLFFYERLLPFRHIFQWLNHSPKPTQDFVKREFAFEYSSGAYQRYNSFPTQVDFKKAVVTANPTRFEVGAVYTVNPKERKNLPKSAMKPLSKELVFDIDLTDYDEIRTCCSGTDICVKCWKFIQVASQIIELALREDFGFKHLIWVFSGRRGAHCWVSDSRARQLDEVGRRSIVEYLDILGSKQNKMGKKSFNLKKPFHPHVERSFGVMAKHFTEIVLQEQDPWYTQPSDDKKGKNWEQVEELLSYLPDKTLQQELRLKWQNSSKISTSKDKWDDINVVAQKVLKSQTQAAYLKEAKKDIVVYYLYPRLDIEVSKQVIHLLKSPFCVHPGTGNVCVPFNPKKNLSSNTEDDEYGFNPTNSPNLRQLQNEIEIYDTKRVNRESSQPLDESDSELDNNNLRIADYEKTSLKPYVDYFGKFVQELLKDEMSESKRNREDDPLDF